MRRSYGLGLILGILLTVGAWHFLRGFVQPAAHAPTPAEMAETDPADLPLVRVDDDFDVNFPGHDDLLGHRAKLKPSITVETWDRALKDTAKLEASADCTFVTPSTAITISETEIQPLLEAKKNVLFFNRKTPRCFKSGSKLTVMIDNLVDGKNFYQIPGQIEVNRIIDFEDENLSPEFLNALGLQPLDAAYLANTETATIQPARGITVMHVTMTGTKPVLDPKVVPSFVPGAKTLKAASIADFFKQLSPSEKPLFVDARDLSNLTQGASYPGSISVPLKSSHSAQLRFQLDLPTSVFKGASFETRALTAPTRTPLVVYGNDDTDMAPLWLIRTLRQRNYRSVFYVEGGLKALNQVTPPITL